MTSYFHSSRNVRKVVDKTYYSYDSELTCEEKNHLVSFINDAETFKNSYEIPSNYAQYVPLVHVLNYGNIHGNSMVIFYFYYCVTSPSFAHILLKLNYIPKYVIVMFFNRNSQRIVFFIRCI